uniref:Brevican core protein-like n=1 Tax=Scophthalmus maximus TaxID=52904 RepID=A0A8D3D4S1_SCOMX
MLLRRIGHVLPLLCAVCRLTLAFPTQTPSGYEDVQSLQVNIPHSGPVFASLGRSISIPCMVSLSTTASTSSSSSPVVPRVKWSVVSGGVETQILVAKGERVKVNEAYRYRAALLNYTSSSDDLSLWLEDLRSSDSGHYRCEVQQGLEDASDLVQLKVKGVVFHYRDALGRYAFTFHQAQRACEATGAEIATDYQLLAAYHDGYEQCDAGWVADQSVRYPIQVPREGCYGDMDGQPGLRSYGTMDPDDLFDVYCYVEQIDGEVIHDSVRKLLSFAEAQSYCRAAGAELATTAQLYLAWSEGLDRCSPGWLSDGSVRYPIITPRVRCGGPQAGVKTLYRFSNQTGFPEPSSLHDVYCFRDNRNAPTDSPVDYMATEPEDTEPDVVMLMETDEEMHLNQHAEQVEREAQSVLESFPFVSHVSTEEYLVDTHPTVTSDTTESPINTTSTLDLLQPFDETSSPTEMSSHAQHPTLMFAQPLKKLRFPQTLEGEANVRPTLEEIKVSPTLEGEANVRPTLEDIYVSPTLEGEANVSPPLEEEADGALALEEQANIVTTLEQEAYFVPTVVEDFTIFPLDSQTSNWALLTTTTGPQESLNDLEYSRKATSTVAPDSASSTKTTGATTKTTAGATTTTTHWSRRTWSPTASRPRVFHKTTEPQKVTHLIPPQNNLLITGPCFSDACLGDPCLNGGTCTDRDGQIKCLCLPSYGGNFCQTDLEQCEPGWDKFHGFCYRHFSQRLSWEVAEQHCRVLGAHLVSVMTPEEQSYINDNYKEYQWTGLNDKTIEDDFRWSDGNPLLYENWYRGQPDSYFLSGEDCVVMVWHDDGRWSDVPCNYHLAYTCKKGTSSCGPPPRVRNASVFGKPRQRYETNAVVRYHCAKGFQQRLNPLVRCRSGGMWERPQIMCSPAMSPTDNLAVFDDEFEATKETPQYWDIKF